MTACPPYRVFRCRIIGVLQNRIRNAGHCDLVEIVGIRFGFFIDELADDRDDMQDAAVPFNRGKQLALFVNYGAVSDVSAYWTDLGF